MAPVTCPPTAATFDFDAAVTTPFRMQPGLRRQAPGRPLLTPLQPGCRTQREKLAVLSAFWRQALLSKTGFAAQPALKTLMETVATAHAQTWQWDGCRAIAPALATAVTHTGHIEPTGTGSFGLGDEVARCLAGLPPHWRLPGLLSLAFAEDFAIINGADATIPWLAVTLPSFWAPEEKVGLHFAQVHAPVADNSLLIKAAEGLSKLVCGPERWERFVWTITDQPCLHTHPQRVPPQRWVDTAVQHAYWRTEVQSFIPMPGLQQAVFTIHVQVQALAQMLAQHPGRAAALHAAVASMSEAVLAYRGLLGIRTPLLTWLNSLHTSFPTKPSPATEPIA